MDINIPVEDKFYKWEQIKKADPFTPHDFCITISKFGLWVFLAADVDIIR
jgi:hypothetical protein